MGATGVLGRVLGTARSRFVFVVGKGGVGKTTTAGALALARADSGRATHLLSTDPAHSLGDLFGTTLAPGLVHESECAGALTLEELDAPADAARWIEQAGPAVAELLEAGTYLESEDVTALLERTFPAMDEIMAALRLADLAGPGAGERFDHVVVDTAPTGHTLRLLDSASVLEGWAGALEALAAKASAVASPFAGRHVRFAGEAVMEDLRARVGRFSTEVLARADFVVVTRGDEVVRAETERLLQALTRRDLAPPLLVGIGHEPDTSERVVARVSLPLRPGLHGCAGLRSWGAGGALHRVERAASPAEARTPAAAAYAMDALRGRHLLLFAGKGGVGKSTCAAAVAATLAREGRRVLLLSTDPAGSLGEVLCCPVGAEPTPVRAGLVARQIDAAATLERFRSRYRDRLAEAFRRLGVGGAGGAGAEFDRQVLESIIGLSPPGIDEVFALQALMESEADHDVVVIDSAPTGHFLRLIQMPGRALAWTRAILRVLLKYRAVLGLDDFAEEVLQWARDLRAIIELLQDPARAGVVLVTVNETLPRLETERLIEQLGVGAVPLLAVIENRRGAAQPSASGLVVGTDQVPLRIVAPLLDPPPTGPDALFEFGARWTPC